MKCSLETKRKYPAAILAFVNVSKG